MTWSWRGARMPLIVPTPFWFTNAPAGVPYNQR